MADEFAKLHNLRAEARADMKLLNKRIQELETGLFAKMKEKSIDELQIRDELVLLPRERCSLVVKRQSRQSAGGKKQVSGR